jgi:CDP-diacylglycerol--glycerol-3-phosphate 3-phosphatidyltransferase
MGSSTVRLERKPTRESSLLPPSVVGAALEGLDSVAYGLVRRGISANAVTLTSLGLAALGAVLVATGELGWATPVIALASLGDALDGLVARRGGSASVGGALLDASVDRYEEAMLFGGLAVLFRESTPALVAVVAALTGSFMVSYGSAKAEGLGRPVPPGAMRRPERAIVLLAGIAATPPATAFARSHALPTWAGQAPLLAALVVIGVVANVSAVLRLRRLGAG